MTKKNLIAISFSWSIEWNKYLQKSTFEVTILVLNVIFYVGILNIMNKSVRPFMFIISNNSLLKLGAIHYIEVRYIKVWVYLNLGENKIFDWNFSILHHLLEKLAVEFFDMPVGNQCWRMSHIMRKHHVKKWLVGGSQNYCPTKRCYLSKYLGIYLGK